MDDSLTNMGVMLSRLQLHFLHEINSKVAIKVLYSSPLVLIFFLFHGLERPFHAPWILLNGGGVGL